MLVGKVAGEGEVGAELLETLLAIRTGAVGVDQAAYGGEVTCFEFCHRRPNLGHPADNLVAGNARIDGGHHTAPLIADLVQVRVTDAAEENFNLHVTLSSIAPRDRSGRKAAMSHW
jgi:hypothetical protein